MVFYKRSNIKNCNIVLNIDTAFFLHYLALTLDFAGNRLKR